MKEPKTIFKMFRLTILIVSIIGLLSSLPFIATMFAYGIGDNEIMALYFPSYVVLGIATVINLFKWKIGYYLTIISALICSLLLIKDVGYFLIFEPNNYILYLILFLPFILFLSLIPITVVYLTSNYHKNKLIAMSSIFFAFGIFSYTIIDRYNQSFNNLIFIEANISDEGIISLNCRPGFGDSRNFSIKTKSNNLEADIKNYGMFYKGDYFLDNTKVLTHFRFSKLKSITLVKFGNHTLANQFTWTKSELIGNTDFLKP